MATLSQIANADPNISLFCRGLKLSGIDDQLSQPGTYTLLAPVNLALGKLSSLSYEQLLQTNNREKLIEFLSGYILDQKKLLSSFRNDQELPTLGGIPVKVSIMNGDIHINGAKILAHDRQGSNGVIHLLATTCEKTPAA
jgi:uncharacterized surface protein with fasciclin (FAS1) repeats